MTILKQLGLAFVLSTAILACSLSAQTSASPSPGASTNRRPVQPCWKQAGISSSSMPQIREIRQTMHSQVESVCSDSSLTAQQKQEKIQQVRQDAYQQADSLVGSQQFEAFRSCQEQRAGTASGTHHGSPCGGKTAHSRQRPSPQGGTPLVSGR